jgi:hypothetical protein
VCGLSVDGQHVSPLAVAVLGAADAGVGGVRGVERVDALCVLCYVARDLQYQRGLWHACVLLGAVMHYNVLTLLQAKDDTTLIHVK